MIDINNAHPGWIKPHAGVTTTSPTMGPTQAPEIDTWPRIASMTTQVTRPAAAAAFVFTNASAAKPLEQTNRYLINYFLTLTLLH
jgi:hypothetical protein